MADPIPMNSPADFLPNESVPVVRLNPETRRRELVHLRWGLIPSWADDPSIASRLTHARAETVATKPAFRDSFRQRRCLLVVDSFNVGRQSGKSYAIQMINGKPFGVGAIWDRWVIGGSEPIESCALITTEANELVRPINDRMPVTIAEEDYGRWLDPEFHEEPELERMMEPFPEEEMTVVPSK